jgi:glycosyltransferase involved in cell wall biosynthesis
MRVLLSVTYYCPHVSGLTIYVQRLAEGLAVNGIPVTVLTSRHLPSLPLREVMNGVNVVRLPVAFRVSKGVVMPTIPFMASRLVRQHDIVAVNLPCTPSEGLILPYLARRQGRPLTAIYHCDVQLPPGIWNNRINRTVRSVNSWTGKVADRVIGYTSDYAGHAPFLRQFHDKCRIIPPPVAVNPADPARVEQFRREQGGGSGPLIGFAARFAAEKGVEHMLRALPLIREKYPQAQVLFAGEHRNVIGEEKFRLKMRSALKSAAPYWHFLGVLSPAAMSLFYAASDVTVLPSTNSTESFGLVQVESMLCGTPVVATDIPGVRIPIRTTGMGRIIPPANSEALAEAVCEVIGNRAAYVRPRSEIEALYSIPATVGAYISLFRELVSRGRASEFDDGRAKSETGVLRT